MTKNTAPQPDLTATQATSAGGRRCLLTPAVAETICAYIRAGNYFATACQMAGISPHTGHEWIRRGENRATGRASNTEFATFATAIKKANAECEGRIVAEMQQAGKNDWKYHMAFLERRFPERWSRIERHISKFNKMSETELDEFIAAHDGPDGENETDV